jgi:putative ABC transport system permease protein
MWWNALWLALRAIRRNPMRSFLTMVGIVIGVAAVITMVTIGNGATAQVTQQIASLGSNLLMIRPGQRLGPGQPTGAAPFDLRDVKAIAEEIGALSAVAPVSSKGLTVIYGNEHWSTSVTGATNVYFKVGNWVMARGRQFTQNELRAGSAVCILGDTVRRELFGRQDPLGSQIRLQKFTCQVVGLLAPKGQSAMGRDQDDIVVVPLRTVQRRLVGNQDIPLILASARDVTATDKVKQEITHLLRQRRRIAANEDDDFSVLDTKQIADMLTGTTQVLTTLLGAVAAVSLLVGGVGIMNIMLVSVTERTREIGIRLAIGALERDVLLQFLVEAVVLSSLGGLFGVMLALIASVWLADLMQVPFVFNPGIMIMAFMFSAAVGVIFGYFPAQRAARLDPIEALRHE